MQHFALSASLMPSPPPPQAAFPLDWSATGQEPVRERVFSLGHWQVRLTALDAQVHEHEGLGVVVVVRGRLYSHDLRQLPALYARHGEAFVDQLDGAFALVLLDLRTGALLACTDHFGTHKLYWATEAGALHLGSSLRHPEFARRPLSLAGVGCYLANGGMLGDCTPLEGVRTLERAHMYRAVATEAGVKLAGQAYWRPVRSPERTRRPVARWEAELAELLLAAVARTVRLAGPRPALSLSAGYDSRALLCLLSRLRPDLRCFSYALISGDQPMDPASDASLARDLARQYGCAHRVLSAYRGDLAALIERGGRWGMGLVFCDEADAWAELSAEDPSDVFVAEQLLEWPQPQASSAAEVLSTELAEDFRGLDWLSGVLSPDVFALLQASCNAQHARVLEGVAQEAVPVQRTNRCLLDQRLQYQLLPWREHFAGHSAEVHNPFLDRSLLDFIGRLPEGLQVGKRLFAGAMCRLDPDYLNVPLARVGGYKPDWRSEIIRGRDALSRSITAVPSRLDALLPPETLQALLVQATEAPPTTSLALRALHKARRSRLARTLLGSGTPPVHRLEASTVLMRALSLRAFDHSLTDGSIACTISS